MSSAPGPRWHLLLSGVVIAAMVTALFLPWRVPDDPTARTIEGPEALLGEVVVVVLAALFVLVSALVMRASDGWPALLVALGMGVIAVALVGGAVGSIGQGICWDGPDSQGRPVGDCYTLVPGPGAWLALGAVTAGLFGTGVALLLRRSAVSSRRSREAQQGPLD